MSGNPILPTDPRAVILAPTAAQLGQYPGPAAIQQLYIPSLLTGVVPIEFKTDHDSAVAYSFLAIDGVVVATLEGAPGAQEFHWDTSTVAPGNHSIAVYAGATDCGETGVYAGSTASYPIGIVGAGFSGSNWLQVTTNAALSPNQPLSFGCWVNLSSVAADQIIACKGNSGGTYEWIFHFSATLGFRVAIDVVGGVTQAAWTGTTPVAGTWYYASFTLAGGSLTCYQNGVAGGVNSSCSGNFTHDNTYDLTLGRSLDGLEGLVGSLDEAGLWSAAPSWTSLYNAGAGKTFAELSAGDLAGLTAWWSLNAATGTTRSDNSGNGHFAFDHGNVAQVLGHVA